MNEFEEKVLSWINANAPIEFFDEFKQTAPQELIRYHSTLGRAIRNEFKLWETAWTPEIVNGIDMSASHPDFISMRTIENIWRFLNKGEN